MSGKLGPKASAAQQTPARTGDPAAPAAGRVTVRGAAGLPLHLLPPAAPVPPPGTGRGASSGEEGWSRGQPASASGFASPGHPRSETPPRIQTADLGGQTCCLTDFPVSL